MNLLNLTPHDIQIWENDKMVLRIPAEMQSARCIEKYMKQDSIYVSGNMEYEHDLRVKGYQRNNVIGVCIADDLSYAQVVGLPEQELDEYGHVVNYYIVSILVAQNSPDRKDLLIPYDLVRSEKGQIVGCRKLARLR